MPLKNRDREHVERVKVELLIFDDNLSLAADDKIDLVVEMTMRSRALAWRDFRHNDAERFAVAADARIDNVSEIAHRRRFENQILLLHQHFAFSSELLFVHRKGHLLGVHFRRATAGDLSVINLAASSGDQRLARILTFLRIDPKLG